MAKKPAPVATDEGSACHSDVPAHLSQVFSRIIDLHYEALAAGRPCTLMPRQKVLDRLGVSRSELVCLAIELKWRGYALIIAGDRNILISPKNYELRFI